MSKPLKLGIAGLGTVGSGLINLINMHKSMLDQKSGRSIEIHAVCARNRDKDRGIDLDGVKWFDDAGELAKQKDIDVFVELIGGDEGIAKQSIEAALKSGTHVVTANKALLAHCGSQLARLAEENNVALNFEAAVAGGIPIVKTMRESLLGNEITRVYGILNGTCNYILTRMEKEGRSFDEILKDAQKAGYAEADPTFDVGGHDTAHKLALLTSLAFGTETSFDTIYMEGIETITPADIEAASDLGYRIKLLGVALKTESGIEQRVHPTMVPKHMAIADVDGVTNCVAVDGDFIGDVMLVGPGAGAGPTASSVMSDIVDIARGLVLPPFITPANKLKPYKRARMKAHEGGYYTRMHVYDRPGAFAAIAGRMAEQGISLESIVQRRPKTDYGDLEKNPELEKHTPVVMITHATSEESIKAALETIEKDGHVDGKPQMIRMEEL